MNKYAISDREIERPPTKEKRPHFLLAGLLKTVCSDVEVEPQLQELEGEQFTRSSTLTDDQTRPDIRARVFYRAGQVAFFDVKVINPNSNSYLQHSTKKTMQNAERQKSRCYNERILNVERGSFAPLIYTVAGGMRPQAKTFEKLLCNKLAFFKQK